VFTFLLSTSLSLRERVAVRSPLLSLSLLLSFGAGEGTGLLSCCEANSFAKQEQHVRASQPKGKKERSLLSCCEANSFGANSKNSKERFAKEFAFLLLLPFGKERNSNRKARNLIKYIFVNFIGLFVYFVLYLNTNYSLSKHRMGKQLIDK
jgi:hypothetical protein